PDAVAGDVHHVVDAAEEPEIAVLVALRAVSREVDPGPLRPVLRLVALRIAVDPAQHRRPRAHDGEVAAADLDAVAALVEDCRLDAGERLRRRAGLRGHDSGQRRDEDRAGLGLPPRVDDGAALAADVLPVPHP